jgi:DNA polymerase-1
MGKALVDVEIIAHRELAVDRPLHVSIKSAIAKVWEWRGLCGMKEVVCCWSSSKNFRKVLSDTYKAHRSPKPEGYDEMVHTLMNHFPVQKIEGLEADDVMGILQTSNKFGETRIVSIDKDMRTIPGWLINPDHYDAADWQESYWKVTQEEADLWHLHQTVIGDTADGFKGIPGAGPKAAEKIECWDDVVKLGEKKGVDEEYLVLQARLAHILRRDDYLHEQGAIKLWTPPGRTQEFFSLKTMEVCDAPT